MSIGKSQALALADNFLNGIGEGKEDLKPRETISELLLLAAEFVEDSQNNLESSHSNASGDLSKSIKALEPVTSPGKIRIDVEMLQYGLFVNAGVKGTKSGSSTAGYAFKKAGPSRSFVNSIMEWQKQGKIKTSNVKRTFGANEAKSVSIAQLSSAYAIARSIMQKGLKPTGFIDKAFKTTEAKVEDRLGSAFEIDIINSISI